MGSRGLDRRRPNSSGERSAYSRLRTHNEEKVDIEFVEVSSDLKRHVIGTGGRFVKEIMKKSGAVITSEKEDEGFTVRGDEEQRACAKSLILEKVRERQSRKNTAPFAAGELVPIPAQYKGFVIGKGGDKLREISTQSGAKVISKPPEAEVYIVSGTEQQRKVAKMKIGLIIAGARHRGVENEFNKVCCFIDGWNLPSICALKLYNVLVEDQMLLSGSDAQYRLKLAEEYELQESRRSNVNSDSDYLLKLADAALESLHKVKHNKETEEYPKADIWCHFGKAIIRGPDEDEADEGEWSTDQAREKLQSSNGENYWKVAFNGGVNFEEKILDEISCGKTPEDYIARYDLTYVVPFGHEIRCKVWVARKDIQKRLEDIQIPFSDVKNILEEIHFEDEITRSRCRGWLVLASRKYLVADIMFPGCEFDCRFTIRGRADCALSAVYAPKEEVRHALSQYLSGLTLTDEDAFGLRLPENEIPEGFYLIHKRSSIRSMYSDVRSWPGFTIILSKECSWRGDCSEEEPREKTDLHLHCKEWDTMLSSGQWEPQAIVDKLPEFFEFAKQVQGFVAGGMRGPAAK